VPDIYPRQDAFPARTFDESLRLVRILVLVSAAGVCGPKIRWLCDSVGNSVLRE
jgi:hypothetical protein